MQIIDTIAAQAAGIATVRRDIHAHPELCFEELRTADLVAQNLADWGIPLHRGLGTTGVVGIVHGRDGGACGRAIGAPPCQRRLRQAGEIVDQRGPQQLDRIEPGPEQQEHRQQQEGQPHIEVGQPFDPAPDSGQGRQG